ncbi:hypothetical protein F4778DRAFT_74258 [Xylariomycetidae sp. FL2044]|nr:hypothetical protein F4778DRAFT_74258 [Xylariomycetidae sp. FL2044]
MIMANKHGWKVELIPWDHACPGHVKRMYDQRVACGWRQNEVPLYIEGAKRSTKMMYWVVFAKDLPDREQLIQRHTATYPDEACPLRDTASEGPLIARQPTAEEFTPVGHVAVSVAVPEDCTQLDKTVYIGQLYISRALHRGGYGAGAMSKIEEVAAKEPINAKYFVLDTVARDMRLKAEEQKQFEESTAIQAADMSKQEWYERQGYEVFRKEENGYGWPTASGSVIPLSLVFMRKKSWLEDMVLPG